MDSATKVLRPGVDTTPHATPYLGAVPSVPSSVGSVNTRHVLPVHRVGVKAL